MGMDALRRHVATIKGEQTRALAHRQAASRASNNRAMISLVTLGAFIVGLVGGGVYLVRHYFNERLKTEEDRNRAFAQVEEANHEMKKRAVQLEALNQELEAFSYSVSHDLRAPLRHIAGFADMLQRNSETQLDDKGRRFLQTIMDSARRMGILIDDLLVFSKMGRTEMREENVDLNSIVATVIEELKSDVGGRNVVWKTEPLPMVAGDRALLRQVVTNLLSNALKYSAPRDPAVIEVRGSNKNGEVIVSVRDNGGRF
jgi:light-regulated signal transduction histidine kinase (bacteriophytochrome)